MSAEFIKACKTLKLSPAQKGVLMTMAWYATDDGEFWYSVATICEWTCFSERTVRQALHDLAKLKVVKAEFRTGGSTKYTLTPAAFAPIKTSHPTSEIRYGDLPTPAADAAPPAAAAPDKQIELLKTNKTKRTRVDAQDVMTAADLIALGVEEQHAKDFMVTRKTKKAGAFTKTAFQLLEREAREAGISLAAAVQMAAERSWTSFKADWLTPKKPSQPSRHVGLGRATHIEGVKPNGRF